MAELGKSRLKKCSKCLKIKFISDFYKDKQKKSGKRPDCISCNKKTKQLNYEKNKYKISIKHKEYYNQNKIKINRKQSLYYQKNKQKIIRRNSSYSQLQRKTNPLVKLKYTLRCRLLSFLKYKKWKKVDSSIRLLGCSIKEFKDHLERNFKPGMTWENHGSWHIDHIIPLASGKNKIDLYKLCHYTNLQPLWAKENLKKNKY